MPVGKICGCKGIRTCLLCEKQSDICAISQNPEENQHVFTYCPDCNLCWPNDEATASLYNCPLYLGKIKLVPEFSTKEEESEIISFIDKIPWMPSQSGRRKQDFGPKVNFKKKKVKIGEFKGFPKFTESLISKFQDLPELSDFDPVELCNLEYTPERGSSIDPHVDDFWLWGERLVTLNLNSTTVLTLVPCSEATCECFQEANCSSFQLSREHTNKTDSCNHQNVNSIKDSIKYLPENNITDCKSSNFSYELLKDDLQNLELSNNATKDKRISFSPTPSKIKDTEYSETHSNSGTTARSLNCSEILDLSKNKSEVVKINNDVYKTTTNQKVSSEINKNYSMNCKVIDHKINSICNSFRSCSSDSKVCIRIVLPPRSLFILSGCARYNWFHEIKRQDVASRRLAMTFRELSAEFLSEGKEGQCGKDLLSVAKCFYDL